MRRLVVLTCAATLLLGLSACAPESEEPAAEPVPEETVEATPTPTSAPAAPATIPECTELLADEQVGEFFEEAVSRLDYEALGGDPWFTNMIGPRAAEAHGQATQTQGCVWGIQNSDQFTAVTVSELPDSALADFMTALRASDYVEEQRNGKPVFRYASDPDYGIPAHNWYGFHENVWVGVITVWGEREAFSTHVFEQVIATNP